MDDLILIAVDLGCTGFRSGLASCHQHSFSEASAECLQEAEVVSTGF